MTLKETSVPLLEEYRPNVEARHTPCANTGCWWWTGWVDDNGYGRVSVRKHWRTAHRVSYELAKGPIPEGLTLDHLCRNRSCINPDHLEPVTHVENVLRGMSPAAQHARQQLCSKGHDDWRTASRTNGKQYRRCRTCAREWNRNQYRRAHG